MTGVDTFTEGLRIAIWTITACVVLLAVGWNAWFAIAQWWGKRQRRGQLKTHDVVWDWSVDGGVETDDVYPRSHVHMPDDVPLEWVDQWK